MNSSNITEKPTGFLRDTLTTGIVVIALTAVATMGTGCGAFTQDNAAKITGHVSDAAGLNDAQKAELLKLTKQAHSVATGETNAAPKDIAADAPKAEASKAPADNAQVAGEWIDRIAGLVALFSGEKFVRRTR